MFYDENLREEEIKNRVGSDFFSDFDTTGIIGNIDFSVKPKGGLFQDYFLWAEAKKGKGHDIYESIAQLVLTIGKSKVHESEMPPYYLGAFDSEKIAFVPYYLCLGILSRSSIDWTRIKPSNHSETQFQTIAQEIKKDWSKELMIFDFDKDEQQIKDFIKKNFVIANAGNPNKTEITKNNFVAIFQKWYNEVRPSIQANWETWKRIGVEEVDFYFADIFATNNNDSIVANLSVILNHNQYKMQTGRNLIDPALFTYAEVDFNDSQEAHKKFWNRYSRPPKKVFWDYIRERRDLCVLQNVRERKGSYFTPQKWVERSQEYIADTLGENWQDEYYIWDCCAGTGNLLVGLTNKYRIWASTLDNADVQVMKEQVKTGANLLEEHIFQFDFLNDDFEKLRTEGQQELYDIIHDAERRKHLVIYINPPYAEAASANTISGTGINKKDVANKTLIWKNYKSEIGSAANELYAQFFIRIFNEVNGCILAEFSKLKILQGSNFAKFRKVFRAKLESLFIVPANTFDNVSGQFPIGFFIWNTGKQENFQSIKGDICNSKGSHIGEKIFNNIKSKRINKWLPLFKSAANFYIGKITFVPPDFQHNKQVAILSKAQKRYCYDISPENLIPVAIYYAVRKSIKATWQNDRDQFLFPKDTWLKDTEFQSNCLVFTMFDGGNYIQSKFLTNYWIPFKPDEVNARNNFASSFMSDFITGRIKPSIIDGDLTEDPEAQNFIPSSPIVFSNEASAVMDAGRELWKYYHSKNNVNINASLYDIKQYFQGTHIIEVKKGKDKGKEKEVMNNTSTDLRYNELLKFLNEAITKLAKKIEPKIYEHHFLEKSTILFPALEGNISTGQESKETELTLFDID